LFYFLKNYIKNLFKIYIECFTNKYFQFSGRANRREFFIFLLFDTIISLLIHYLSIPLFFIFYLLINIVPSSERFVERIYENFNFTVWIYFLYLIISIIPSLTVSIRRLHDFNFNGWWCLIVNLLPVILCFLLKSGIKLKIGIIYLWIYLICFIVLIICMLFIKGTPTTNKYGEPSIN